MQEYLESDDALAAVITWAASKQTYYTVRLLVDRPLVSAAFQAYAYFRWLDDELDQGGLGPHERLAFVARQQELMEACYRRERPHDLSAAEWLLANLIRSDQEVDSGLQRYIRCMMAVMRFDAERRGRLISQAELAEYTRLLATGVTEALHYFIGHHCPPPRSEKRYLAATGAHITHMLRDTMEDTAAGYFNIPREFLEFHHLAPQAVADDAYRAWVQSRVALARDAFVAGCDYLAQVKSLRCRLAGYAYIARFDYVLDVIERDGYRLRPSYDERRSGYDWLRLGWLLFAPHRRRVGARPLPAR